MTGKIVLKKKNKVYYNAYKMIHSKQQINILFSEKLTGKTYSIFREILIAFIKSNYKKHSIFVGNDIERIKYFTKFSNILKILTTLIDPINSVKINARTIKISNYEVFIRINKIWYTFIKCIAFSDINKIQGSDFDAQNSVNYLYFDEIENHIINQHQNINIWNIYLNLCNTFLRESNKKFFITFNPNKIDTNIIINGLNIKKECMKLKLGNFIKFNKWDIKFFIHFIKPNKILQKSKNKSISYKLAKIPNQFNSNYADNIIANKFDYIFSKEKNLKICKFTKFTKFYAVIFFENCIFGIWYNKSDIYISYKWNKTIKKRRYYYYTEDYNKNCFPLSPEIFNKLKNLFQKNKIFFDSTLLFDNQNLVL